MIVSPSGTGPHSEPDAPTGAILTAPAPDAAAEARSRHAPLGSCLEPSGEGEPACAHVHGRPPSPLPELLRVPHLAAALGLSENAIRDLLARGELPASKVGRQWVVRREALLDHLAEQERLRQPRCSVESVVAAIRRAPSPRDLARHARAAR